MASVVLVGFYIWSPPLGLAGTLLICFASAGVLLTAVLELPTSYKAWKAGSLPKPRAGNVVYYKSSKATR